ncbi:aminotransferase class I/II-fold pyridoxal phosphate-dependent enzyme [Candidatus Chloroploca mongolica]|uniref:aminotransferase class I/II-fold pyridoxal phosphate-dependent enzyme n=1 Tax=Candidatus Chloroploca mongolica TaxID=2528176 RepID=UPI00108170ED
MHTLRPQLTWICAPNNPTGVMLSSAIMQMLTTISATDGGYLILDRSYSDLQRQDSASLPEASSPHLITLHSLTKSYALAGLRLGYLLAAPVLIARVGTFQLTWMVLGTASSVGKSTLVAALCRIAVRRGITTGSLSMCKLRSIGTISISCLRAKRWSRCRNGTDQAVTYAGTYGGSSGAWKR